jgi:hypothetical protein
MNGLKFQFDDWRAGVAAMDANRASTIEGNLDSDLPALLRIGAQAGTDLTFGELVLLIRFLNEAAMFKASILEKLAEHVDEFRDALMKIAARLEATSFTLSVSVPLGLSVSLTFPPLKPR